jgi:hypothetical protein
MTVHGGAGIILSRVYESFVFERGHHYHIHLLYSMTSEDDDKKSERLTECMGWARSIVYRLVRISFAGIAVTWP